MATAATAAVAASPNRKPVVDVFGVDDPLFQRTQVTLYPPSPSTPKPLPGFKFRAEQLLRLILWASAGAAGNNPFGMPRKRNLWVYGPTGCGKTQLIMEFAARVGRPLFSVQCTSDMDMAKINGSWVLCSPPGGGSPEMTYVKGNALNGYGTKNAIILFDEIDILPPDTLVALHDMLDGRDVVIDETGERINMADGVIIAATANTNGRGDVGGAGGNASVYKGTRTLNAATIERFNVLQATYLDEPSEIDLLLKEVGVTQTVAETMVRLANQIRRRFVGANDDPSVDPTDKTRRVRPLEFTISTRNLLNWAMNFQLLASMGMVHAEAFKSALCMTVLDFGSAADRQAVLDAWDNICNTTVKGT